MADDDTPPIPADRVPDDEGDELPEDLDVTAYVGPYLFPTMERRRIPATMYLVLAVLCLLGWLVSSNGGLLGGRDLPRPRGRVPLRVRLAARPSTRPRRC